MRRFIPAALAAALVAMAPATSEGAVLGVLNIDGDIYVTPTTIEWLPPGPAVDGDATGLADIGTSTGIFAPLSNCSDCAIQKNLDAFTEPIDTALNFLNFETYTNAPTLNFTLQTIYSCSTCATGYENTPFNFTQSITGTTVTMNMAGVWSWSANGYNDPLPWVGLWTAQFPGQTIAQVLATLEATGSLSTTFSASKISVMNAVPEPATLLLLGAGSAFLAARRRRTSKKAA